jgi:hypothetical protein
MRTELMTSDDIMSVNQNSTLVKINMDASAEISKKNQRE